MKRRSIDLVFDGRKDMSEIVRTTKQQVAAIAPGDIINISIQVIDDRNRIVELCGQLSVDVLRTGHHGDVQKDLTGELTYETE